MAGAGHRSKILKFLEERNPMRAVLHAKFGDELAKPSSASDAVPRTSLSQLRNSSIEEFEVALTKARAD
jgi:hypothetical protein